MRDVCISHQSDWICYKHPIKIIVFVAVTSNMILLLVSNGNLTLVFLLQVVASKSDKSVTLIHTIRINILDANLAACLEKINVWTYLFLMNSVAF